MIHEIKWLYAWLLPPGLFLLVALAMMFLSNKKSSGLIMTLLVIYMVSIRLVSVQID